VPDRIAGYTASEIAVIGVEEMIAVLLTAEPLMTMAMAGNSHCSRRR
jgi:hypothetical protein